MPLQATPATTALIQFLVGSHFAHLASVLIVYDGAAVASKNSLQQQYLDAVQQAFEIQSQHGKIIGLQWNNVRFFKYNYEEEQQQQDYDQEFGQHILKAVDIVTEGFITILANTSRFLHARYYATRYATLRLKDKLYLFLCEHENPAELLASELLQFYPHHLMVTPANDNSRQQSNQDNKDHNQRQSNAKNAGGNSSGIGTMKTQKPKIQQTCNEQNMVAKETPYKNFAQSRETIAREASDGNASVASSSPTSSSMNQKLVTSISKYHNINFELWTQRYVGAEGNLNAIHLDTFWGLCRIFAKNVELYPNKLKNLQRRVMRVGTLTYLPYVKTNYVEPGEGDEDGVDSHGPNKTVMFEGAEADLVRTFCQMRNCHLRLIPYPPDNWGFIFENGTTEGMLGDLYEQHMELAIGCVYNWYNSLTEVSRFIARSAVTIMGPGPSQYPRWRINIMPFSTPLWISLFLAMIACALVFQLFKYSANRLGYKYSSGLIKKKKYGWKTLEKTMLDVFAVFIQQSSADTSLKRVATRVFLAFLLCATITLESTYSGQLKSLLTMPLFNSPIDTIDKWSLTKWKWGAPSIIWITTVEQSDLKHEQLLTKSFEVRDYEFLYNASFRSDYGLALERLYSGSLNIGDYITMACLKTRILLRDDLYFDWTRAVAIMGWPLMPLLDRHISFCLETGLYISWERHYKIRSTNLHMQEMLAELSSGHIQKPPPQNLSIEHISGPLFILFFGHISACIVLLFELLGNQVKGKFVRFVKIKYFKA
uniref:Ionotropic glutamate receptor C-terminal domain-containing protein n=1 Tax=Stomoxys calcitrans TaxID=35570 RepID=A0A1I8PFK8_STOCA